MLTSQPTNTGACTPTFVPPTELQPALVVIVQPSVSVPSVPPAVYVIDAVPSPAVIVPLEIVHTYDAPPPASGTDAVLLVEFWTTEAAAVITETGIGFTIIVMSLDVADEGDAQTSADAVITSVTTSPFCNVEVRNVTLVAPVTAIPLVCHW